MSIEISFHLEIEQHKLTGGKKVQLHPTQIIIRQTECKGQRISDSLEDVAVS